MVVAISLRREEWCFRLSQWRETMAVMWGMVFHVLIVVLVIGAIVGAYFTLPIDKMLNGILIWIHGNLGPWGPLALALLYIPLTIIAVPGSILTVGGGYLFGAPIGFLADSVGATLGATAAFLVGKTIGRPYVMRRLKNYPQFQAIELAIEKSSFKVVILLRMVPLLPFNVLNYLLSLTSVNIGQYILASWIGMMPVTLALVYVGTTIKDLSEASHGWGQLTTLRWILLTAGLVTSVVLLVVLTQMAKASLGKAVIECESAVITDHVNGSQNGSQNFSGLNEPLLAQEDGTDPSFK